MENSPKLVRELMTVGVATCPPAAPLAEIARLLLEQGLEALVVLDPEEGHALGVVGQDELLAAYSRAGGDVERLQALTAAEVMRDDVPQVPPDIPLAAAAALMRDLNARALFLMHHAGGVVYPAGVITRAHLLRHLAARSPDELRDLGLAAERKSPLEVFIQRRDEARRRAHK